ncbi:hypothetical protein ANCCAN_18744 [Ancylostoma caninum]|uniref:VWFA domain-containing protein n=1 Tax=Ancylostoma caninum TaxID=29170 RepID=A0A368FTA6_ANCCA|nr:hypothetical protein ANCCAN_18744 [Ancylostoma caninum]
MNNPGQRFEQLKRSCIELSRRSCLYDVVFVFDASGSLEGRFEEQLKVANRLIDVFDVETGETQIAAIKYAGKGKCRLIFDFKDVLDKSSMEQRITETTILRGTTYTNEALMKTADILMVRFL